MPCARFRSNVLAEHARFLESQWVSIYQLTLTNDRFAAYVSEMFDLGSAETAQKDASLLMYINVLAMTFSSWQNKVKNSRNVHGVFGGVLGRVVS